MKTQLLWEVSAMGNHCLNRKGYYVSYNKFDGPMSNWGPASWAPEGEDETAIAVDLGVEGWGSHQFYVLNGDHRDPYMACASLDECLRYYLDHEDQWSVHTNELLPEHRALIKAPSQLEAA